MIEKTTLLYKNPAIFLKQKRYYFWEYFLSNFYQFFINPLFYFLQKIGVEIMTKILCPNLSKTKEKKVITKENVQ